MVIKKVNRIDLNRKPLTCCFADFKDTNFLLFINLCWHKSNASDVNLFVI